MQNLIIQTQMLGIFANSDINGAWSTIYHNLRVHIRKLKILLISFSFFETGFMLDYFASPKF